METNNEPKRQFEGFFMPASLLYDPELTPREQVLLCHIRSLSDSEKGCWASNKYLAGMIRVSVSQCEKLISSLIKRNYLEVTKRAKYRRYLITRINAGSKPASTRVLTHTPYESEIHSRMQGKKAGAFPPGANFGLNGHAKDNSPAAKLARFFFKKATTARMLVGKRKPQFSKWKAPFQTLIDAATSPSLIKEVMEAHFDHARDEWWPSAQAPSTFVEKFQQIQKAMCRLEPGKRQPKRTKRKVQLRDGSWSTVTSYED